MNTLKTICAVACAALSIAAAGPARAENATLTVQVDKPGVKVSPMLWGIFFEDINLLGRRRHLRRTGPQPLVRGRGQAGPLDGWSAAGRPRSR